MTVMLVGRRWAVGGCLVVLAACAPVEVAPPPTLPAVPVQAPVLYEWHTEGLYGAPSVVIDLQMQRAEVFIGGQYAGWSVVATGKEGFGTPAGEYTILEKVVNKHSTLYGRIVDTAGNTVKADADARRDTPPPGGRFLYARMPVLDAPDLAGHRDACRTDTPAGKSGITRVHSLAPPLRDSALPDGADRNPSPHHPLRS